MSVAPSPLFHSYHVCFRLVFVILFVTDVGETEYVYFSYCDIYIYIYKRTTFVMSKDDDVVSGFYIYYIHTCIVCSLFYCSSPFIPANKV